eukprot:scaffold68484_cov41-Cyclotella_meneghiniana.AAC.2
MDSGATSTYIRQEDTGSVKVLPVNSNKTFYICCGCVVDAAAAAECPLHVPIIVQHVPIGANNSRGLPSAENLLVGFGKIVAGVVETQLDELLVQSLIPSISVGRRYVMMGQGSIPGVHVWLSEPERRERRNKLEKQRNIQRCHRDREIKEIHRRLKNTRDSPPPPSLAESDVESDIDCDSLSSDPVIESGGDNGDPDESYWKDHPVNNKDEPELPTFMSRLILLPSLQRKWRRTIILVAVPMERVEGYVI